MRPSTRIALSALLSVGCHAAAAPGRPAEPPPRDAQAEWQPSATRLFIACLAQFEGEKEEGRSSFSTEDRLDGAFANQLAARGVPADRSTVLLDDRATSSGVEEALRRSLDASQPNETLVFYFGSHGGYDAQTGRHTFSTFDGSLPMEWAVDEIEARFKGSRALLFADSCYSGGLVEIVTSKPRRVAYAALASTSAHELAYSAWRFIDVLMRAFSGDPLMDEDRDGRVEFLEASRFVEHHMAFIAEGKPMYATTGGLDELVLANAARPHPSDPRVGRYVEVEWHDRWYKAEIQAVRGAEALVHYTSNALHESDEWVPPERIRELAFARYAPGAKVDVEYDGRWYPSTVLGSFENLHHIHYDAYSESWDEWVGPSRLRPRASAGAP
ncbi:MAG: agenet domain-containing protein [Polyangiaceae bacterium]